MSTQIVCNEQKHLALADELTAILDAKHAFWGLDKVKLVHLGIKDIDRERLHTKRDCHSGIMIKPSCTVINDKQYGKLVFGKMYGNYCNLSLISDSCNVVTQDIDGIRSRLYCAAEYFESEYGISLYIEYATFDYIEIAFTAAYTDQVPNRVFDILMSLTAESRRSRIQFSPSQERPDARNSYTVKVKNTAATKTNTEFVFYNKGSQLIDKKKLPTNFPINIYRFEICLNGRGKIEKELHASTLFGNHAVSDTSIMEYITTALDNLHDKYIDARHTSVDRAQQIFESIDVSSGRASAISQAVLNQELNVGHSGIIDAETFLYLQNRGTNASRLRKDIIKSLLISQDPNLTCPLIRMDGWIVEDILNDMLDATYRGLGADPSAGENSGIPSVLYSDGDAVRDYLHYLGAKKSRHRFAN